MEVMMGCSFLCSYLYVWSIVWLVGRLSGNLGSFGFVRVEGRSFFCSFFAYGGVSEY
jgi:hypothetical protein